MLNRREINVSCIYIASDHAGFNLKKYLVENMDTCNDLGTYSPESCDYPVYAKKLVTQVLQHPDSFGVLICGSGVGMSIAANRYVGIRAALCLNEEMAALSRQHNNANVIVLGARMISPETALNCCRVFFSTSFEGGRHLRRISLIDQIS